MRSTVEIRLSLTEDDFNKVSMSAFRASKPLSEWIRDQILAAAAARHPPVAAPQPVPALSQPVPEPVTVPALPQPEQEPVSPVAEPEPEEAEPPRKKRNRSVDVPTGFDVIVDLGEKIVAAQAETRQRSGTSRGLHYNNMMTEWYKQNNLGEMPTHIRYQLIEIGRQAEAIRRWYSSIAPGTMPENVKPYTLLHLFGKSVPQSTDTVVFGTHSIRRVPEPEPRPESESEQPESVEVGVNDRDENA